MLLCVSIVLSFANIVAILPQRFGFLRRRKSDTAKIKTRLEILSGAWMDLPLLGFVLARSTPLETVM